MDNCDFCSPEVIAKQCVYTDELIKVIYPQRPISLGHFMIVPNNHVPTYDLLSDEQASGIKRVITRIVEVMKTSYGYQDFNILNNNGSHAGQHIKHVHVHVFMRKEDEAYSPFDVLAKKVEKHTMLEEEWTKNFNNLKRLLANN